MGLSGRQRVAAFCVALALFAAFALGYGAWCEREVRSLSGRYTYYNADARNSCAAAMGSLGDGSIVVLGSSELSASDGIAYPPALLGGDTDFDMVLVGRGYVQSLLHAINVGAFADDLPQRKVVLILSPQWFEGDYSAEAFPDRFLETNYVRFLTNGDISHDMRQAVAERVEALLAGDPAELSWVRRFDAAWVGRTPDPATWLQVLVRSRFMEAKSTHDFLAEARELPEPSGETLAAADIDWGALLEEGQIAGEAACTNNDFGMYDEYYDTYVREGVEAGTAEGSGAEGSMANSSEWGDLELFLRVCEECGVEPLVVSVPVNGRWYDYRGFPKEEREAYYQRVREVCAEHGVALADFSGSEYELYFLRDVMHLGWRGWVHVDEAVYEFWRS